MTDDFAIAWGHGKRTAHWKPARVTWDEIISWMDTPSPTKDTAGYVLGTLRPTTRVHEKGEEPCLGMHRNKEAIVSRSMLALDIDHPEDDFLDLMDLTFDFQGVMHTTHSSAPDELRFRLLIPTDREMAPDEYITAAQAMMQKLGYDQFDPSTSEPERFMYKPSAQKPEWFQHHLYTGPTVSVDTLLDDFEVDLSTKPLPKPNRSKRDPFDIPGVVGAFNKAYEDWDLLIQTYDLPYEKVGDDRYHLVGARSEAGMGPVKDVQGFVYSHHANDPAYGKTCSAFDLVRLHQFGDLDHDQKPQTPINKLPSHKAMLDTAAGDHRVTAQLVGLDFDQVMDEDVATPNEWRLKLRLAGQSGKFVDCIQNWDLLVKHDDLFKCIYLNEFTGFTEADRDLPWREVNHGTRSITNSDRWKAVFYIEREYGHRATRDFVSALIDTCAADRPINPVKEYLTALQWDGVQRVEVCLPGVQPTDFTRLVARKVMVAAVARIYEPGKKWDHTLVLYGAEGLGKSWWIEKMATVGTGTDRQTYSSTLGRIGDKDTLLAMQRSWIMVSDEGHSLRKADHDTQKEFLTRTEDIFRVPYDKETLVRKRHCVIWSTTNDETFLRRQEGNRRFLIVHCEQKVDFDAITDDYVDQVWAEAVHLYNAGERLFLGESESQTATAEREKFIEEDALGGMIEEYLDRLVPPTWWDKSPEQRVQWLQDVDDGMVPDGTEKIDRVCSAQLWVEALGRRKGDARRVDLLDITNAMKRVPGWTLTTNRVRLPGYGPQLLFVREDLL